MMLASVRLSRLSSADARLTDKKKFCKAHFCHRQEGLVLDPDLSYVTKAKAEAFKAKAKALK